MNARCLLSTLGLLAIVVAVTPPLTAQWAPYLPPGVPKTPDGRPDLNAPAPRTPDGRPDLSGLWENINFGRGRGGAPVAEDDGKPVASFFDVGSGFKNGLPFRPWAKDLRDKRNAANSKDNPDALCLPMGNMQFHEHPMPRKIIQNPSTIVILYEGNAGIRQILTDGRPLPANDPQPTWYGYSVGRWDGDTLVVETNGFRDEGWLDIMGSPLTDAAKTIERFRRPNYGTMNIEVTVDDPKAYTRPWTVTFNQRIMHNTELMEFVCAEGQKFEQYLRGDFRPKP